MNMRWEQINGNRWTIPETKNGKSHIVTLHPLALSLLKTQRIISEGGWVFESLSKPSFPVTGDAITRALERLKTKYMAKSLLSHHMIYAAALLQAALNIWTHQNGL